MDKTPNFQAFSVQTPGNGKVLTNKVVYPPYVSLLMGSHLWLMPGNLQINGKNRCQANLRAQIHRQLSASPPVTDEPVNDRFIQKLHQAIEERLDDSTFGVDDLAEAVALSRRTLHRKLTSVTSMTSEQLKKAAPEIQFSNPWEATDPVRIVHLLEHTAGFNNLTLTDYTINDPAITIQEGLDTSVASPYSRWRPGTFMAYSNWGPTMVARVIEEKTGQEFETFVRQHIFNPLGQKTATFRQDEATLIHLVTNY